MEIRDRAVTKSKNILNELRETVAQTPKLPFLKGYITAIHTFINLYTQFVQDEASPLCDGELAGVNIRERPVADASILSYYKGKVIFEGKTDEGWLLVRMDGELGWVSPEVDLEDVTCLSNLKIVPSDFVLNPNKPSSDICDNLEFNPDGYGCVQVLDAAFFADGLQTRSHPTFESSEMGRLDIRTVWRYYARRSDSRLSPNIGCWYLIGPYTEDFGYTIWVRDRVQDGNTYIQYLQVLDNCDGVENELDENNINVQPKIKLDPGLNCNQTESGRICVGAPNVPWEWNDESIITFILACESGNDPNQAQVIAYVIRNRMQVTGRSAVDVVRDGAWHCYLAGALYDTDQNKNALNQNMASGSRIRQVAQSLMALNEGGFGTNTLDPLTDNIPPETEYALYTLGVYVPCRIPPDPSVPTLTPTQENNCPAGMTPTIAGEIVDWEQDVLPRLVEQFVCLSDKAALRRLYVYHSATNPAHYVTVFFTDNPNCLL